MEGPVWTGAHLRSPALTWKTRRGASVRSGAFSVLRISKPRNRHTRNLRDGDGSRMPIEWVAIAHFNTVRMGDCLLDQQPGSRQARKFNRAEDLVAHHSR